MILADEHISAKMIAAIKAIPLEVITVKEKFRGADDDRIIDFARENDLIIITEDKDFGEWIFAHHLPSTGVIFLRYHFRLTDRMIIQLSVFLKQHSGNLKGKFVTITVDRIRVREI